MKSAILYTVLLAVVPNLVIRGEAGLSDFGGDVSEYMSLLQGSSAFSFKPGAQKGQDDMTPPERPRSLRQQTSAGFGGPSSQGHRSTVSSKASPIVRSESALGDFGGDYGNYLQLLEGDTALGFNPQSDPISDNQDLQSDVFGGGMTGKFWDMYKGSKTYDSLDDSDSGILDTESMLRQTPETDQPEDYPNPLRGQRDGGKEENVVLAIKPSKAKVSQIFSDLKAAIKSGDKNRMATILEELDIDVLTEKANAGSSRQTLDLSFVSDENNDDFAYSRKWAQPIGETSFKEIRSNLEGEFGKLNKKTSLAKKEENDESDDDYSKEYQSESETRSVKKNFEDFIDKMKKAVPDPIATSKGLSMSYKNLTLYGISDVKVCGAIKKGFGLSSNTWTSEVCFPRLTTTIQCVTGPGVPFKGKVVGIFKQPKIRFTFSDNGSSIHVESVKTVGTSASKFVPTYDSSIPLNPWSKVSLSGYMVARVKKMLPDLVDKTLLKITHIVENMNKTE